jgi:hypothetical protein
MLSVAAPGFAGRSRKEIRGRGEAAPANVI